MRIFYLFCLGFVLLSCRSEYNNPYPLDEKAKSILYSAFTERPKHLDPVQSYAEEEGIFISQVYEPPLQYHYLKRPFTLIPLTVTDVPVPIYYDQDGNILPPDAPTDRIATSVYELNIKPGIRYQPHPAFALDSSGEPVYKDLDRDKLSGIETIADFKEVGSRELTADDYLYQIKRLAHPHLHSPIFSSMAERIVGLKALAEALKKAAGEEDSKTWLDLDRFELEGASAVDRYTLRIRVYGKYPQFVFWLAMPFFSPVPREADRFYSQAAMTEKNLVLDWYPVGTGPYMLTENNPNSRMVLERNPNFRGETYPCEGEAGDKELGLLDDCGKPLPMVDKAIYSREKESIPYWNKFLQGYYDASGISSDSFDQAVRLNVGGEFELSDELRERGIRLISGVRSSVFYMGFNMLDPVVGGKGNVSEERARKLRQAVSIAIDQEEYISIFMNGRGIPAMSPLAPGIFGHLDGEAGINPVVYDWVDGGAKRKPVEVAKKLLAEAGWPAGRDAKTGEALVLSLDTTSGGMGDKSRLDWLTRQFAKIDIQLVVRSTDFNRFQEKVRKGAVQLYFLGWNADYPDPENMLFLLLGSEGKVERAGENASNYVNAEFDRLFVRMKSMENTPERQKIISRMIYILQQDAPWIFCFHPKSYVLAHQWLHNRKLSEFGHNSLKYQRIDAQKRDEIRHAWNQPVLWPLFVGGVALLSLCLPALISFRRRERSTGR